MKPEERTLLQVRAEDEMREADHMFTTLMGDQVEPRRKFIEDHALDVKNLDVAPRTRRSNRAGSRRPIRHAADPSNAPDRAPDPVNIEDEMKRSYMDYAMSVIIGRALPMCGTV